MNSDQVVETVLVALIGALFALYFAQYFILGRVRRFGPWVNLWYVGNASRGEWAELMMSDPKEGINATQSLRNGMLSASLLATVCSQLASRIIAQLGSADALESFRQLSSSDPITGSDSIATPQLKLCLALGTLLMCILSLVQHVRLTLHLMYLIRAVSGDPRRHENWKELVALIFRRASRSFALGLRMLALFVPAILWTVGITAALIGSIIELAILFSMDLVPASYARLLDPPPDGAVALDLGDPKGAAGGGVQPVGPPPDGPRQTGARGDGEGTPGNRRDAGRDNPPEGERAAMASVAAFAAS